MCRCSSIRHSIRAVSVNHRARDQICDLAETLAERARYGFAGEKPIALWAMLHVMHRGLCGCSGLELLRTRPHEIRAAFVQLARRFGRICNPEASWNRIAGAGAELQRLLSRSMVNDAFRRLEPTDVAWLCRWFRGIPAEVKREVWQRDGGRCARCGASDSLDFQETVAFSRGGTKTASNINLLCCHCVRTTVAAHECQT